MEQRGNKTIMCSVLFLDIVAYSKQSVSAQIAQKELFNAMLAKAIQDVAAHDRVILDTGDGAAVTFLGDVEDGLKAALLFRDTLLDEGAGMEPPLQVCMGINLGPVRLVKDINGRPNIVGDGINVAQRIMGFAKPGQILVSRSYFDAVSRLSLEYAGMFYSEGVRTDKHVREHEIYAVGKPDEATLAQQRVGEDTLGKAVKHGFVQTAKRGVRSVLATFKNAPAPQKALHAGIIASVLALLMVVTVKFAHRPDAPEPQVATETRAASVAVSAVPGTVAASSGGNGAVPKTVAAVPQKAEPLTVKEPKAKRSKDMSVEHEKDSKQRSSRHAHQEPAAKETAAAKPGAMATVSIAVAPWGEVYLDGQKQGVSPPLDVLHVTPGEHAIEFRNTTFPPHSLNIKVKAGEHKKIKYKFAS